jgi:YD repeat-containing protein
MKLFGYDARSRLTSAKWNPTDGSGDSLTYSYDGTGNLVQIKNIAATISYSYDAANEVTSETEATVDFVQAIRDRID